MLLVLVVKSLYIALKDKFESGMTSGIKSTHYRVLSNIAYGNRIPGTVNQGSKHTPAHVYTIHYMQEQWDCAAQYNSCLLNNSTPKCVVFSFLAKRDGKKSLTSMLGLLCRRPERAFSRVVLPAPGGPSSSVNLPGYRMLLIVSRMVKR